MGSLTVKKIVLLLVYLASYCQDKTDAVIVLESLIRDSPRIANHHTRDN